MESCRFCGRGEASLGARDRSAQSQHLSYLPLPGGFDPNEVDAGRERATVPRSTVPLHGVAAGGLESADEIAYAATGDIVDGE